MHSLVRCVSSTMTHQSCICYGHQYFSKKYVTIPVRFIKEMYYLLSYTNFSSRIKFYLTGPFYGYIVAVLVYSCLVVVAQAIFHLYLGLYAVAHQEHYGDVLVASTNSCKIYLTSHMSI